jgi:hypothetical protein
LGIQRHESATGIDHEKQNVGFLDRGEDLPFDLLGQIIDIFDPDPTGIDQLKVAAFMLDEGRQSITGNTRKVLDDRQATTGKPVKNRAFADVGSANNCNAWNSHRKTMDR